MTKEGSNLRDLARRWSENKSIKPGVYNCLMTIADRIDAEMAELPRGKDGKPIRVGETVYGEDGRAWHVEGVVIGRWTEYTESPVVYATGDSGQWRNLLPWLLTHERPDSWERIADELERYVNDSCGEDEIDGATASTLVDFADRIRRMAEEREHERE
ncbi:hypothetical protein DXD59_00690 [Olsenella sp. TM06-36]|uniref:hypothetical protein n=1 Tax=unclassified Olsenella TaxID=2638792 RepID=UPI000E450086|nr:MULTISPECIES: hypothetical protein [unclassified Olsenella]RGJ47447.1 hypothetical protein DXD59_00690 [Olsenella sp. TM06-36]RHJ96144.1 hypothetical protein DW092_00685 [Olsenella sp. AM05-7]RHK00422.1 hypothetical protein DW090_01435 [Olsenella sp. AM05-17]